MLKKKIFPSLTILEQVKKNIKEFPNQKKESLRGVHYGVFLLCSESGLRISEAVSFDLENKTKKGLYRIEKPKRKKKRLVYVSKEVISELKSNNWKPNQTNRFAFYHFLRKIKQKTNINSKIELTPHTLRRTFATYHAEKGVPLPLLQKLLGHSSIRTTALYWQNIYDEDEVGDILAGKRWLEPKKPPLPVNSVLPTEKNFSEPLPENPGSDNKPVISIEKPGNKDNSLLAAEKEKIPALTYQPKAEIREISPQNQGKIFLNIENGSELPIIADEKQILLGKIKELEEKLVKVKSENANLKLENKHLKALLKQELGTEAQTLQLLTYK